MSWSPKQNGHMNFTFALSSFCFSLSSFPSPSTMIITMPSPSSWSSYAPSLGMCYLSHWSLRVIGLALSVSSIHQNQTKAFNLPLFGNWWQPFHKDMNWNSFESMLLAQAFFTMCKGFGQVSWIWIGSISSPYIYAKSLDWSLHICMDWKCGRAMSTKWC